MCKPIPVGWDQALRCATGAHREPPMVPNQRATQEPKQNVEPLSMAESSSLSTGLLLLHCTLANVDAARTTRVLPNALARDQSVYVMVDASVDFS